MKKTLHILVLSALSLLLITCGNAQNNHRRNHVQEAGLRKATFYSPKSTLSQGETYPFAKPKDTSYKTADKGMVEIPAPLRGRQEQILRREGYTVSYNKQLKVPNWVAWHLTAGHTYGHHTRNGIEFQEDFDVPKPRATTFDYKKSHYDRGHMCPSGDNRWSSKAQQQSFLMTNICPQNHDLNRGEWNNLEIKCRQWAKRYGDVYICAGPVFYQGKTVRTIGRNKVGVPDAFFKVVLVMSGTPRAIGFIYENRAGEQSMKSTACTVDHVEQLTGINFFSRLDRKTEQQVESQYNLKHWQ